MQDSATEATIATVASAATKAGAGTVLFGWLTLNDFALIVGLVIATAGFLVNFHYRRKADKRDEQLHARRMSRDD